MELAALALILLMPHFHIFFYGYVQLKGHICIFCCMPLLTIVSVLNYRVVLNDFQLLELLNCLVWPRQEKFQLSGRFLVYLAISMVDYGRTSIAMTL